MNYKEYFKRLEQEDPEFREAWKNLQAKSALAMAMIGYRIKHNISQSELARRVGTYQANISRIEFCNANPTIELVQRILRVLDLEAHFLPPAESTTYDQETSGTSGIQAVEWPVNTPQPHIVAEPRKKYKNK
jgi:transcriptional regulator with XRE-family HTH domain